MKAGRRHCENVARLSVGLLIALQIVDSPDGLTAAQGPRAETTAQLDARIDSIPLISIGDGDDDPLYRVIGAVFYGGYPDRGRNQYRYSSLLRPGDRPVTSNLRHEVRPEIRSEPQRITREDARRFREADDVDRQPPEFYPYYRGARNVAGALWALDYGPADSDVLSWTVLSTKGAIVGRVRSSGQLTVLAVDDDTAAVLRVDDLGIETVELRRIVGWP